MQILLRHGAYVDKTLENGTTALFGASYKGNDDIF